VAANTIRLLIAGSQAGGLIGMSGQNIEKLRNSSGAMITVLAPSQLPLCASAHESDRVVQVGWLKPCS
jgi:poly(rC)-binding protein 2/3/4